jgi:hypothetical protein
MIVPGSANPLLLAGGAATVSGVNRSLRFRGSASAYLSRTFGTPTNSVQWTYSAWVKISNSSATQILIGYYVNASTPFEYLYFDPPDGRLKYVCASTGGVNNLTKQSSAVYRDFSSWYHITLQKNAAANSSVNAVKIYVNGVEITNWAVNSYTANQASIPDNINTASKKITLFGFDAAAGGGGNLDGYATDINFIDGLALDPTSFGQFNATTGVWEAKSYTGAYGTNGFKLDFSDNTTTTTLCQDKSGNNNHWTPNQISLANDATYDSMIDVPPVYGLTADVQPRGNYATFNPLLDWHTNGSNFTLSSGNLHVSEPSATTYGSVASTIATSSGKWYCEITATTVGASQFTNIGITSTTSTAGYPGQTATSYGYQATARKVNNDIGSAYGATYTSGDIIGIAFDADAGTLTFYKNGTSQGTAFTGIPSGSYYFVVGDFATSQSSAFSGNFGQQPFKHTPPSGFRSLCSTNLPEPSIVNGAAHMAVTLDTGANILTAAQAKAPKELIWIKDRANANNHQLIDVVRGANAVLQSNTTSTETTYSAPAGNSVAWQWKGGSSTIPTGGTITPTGASVNAAAGFSVIGYTGNGVAGATVPHGLGAAPSMLIIKARNFGGATDWPVYHSNLTSAAYAVFLNTTGAQSNAAPWWNSTSPTSSVFSIGTPGQAINNSGTNYVAYCWTPIAGYSSFGSYTANASTDGPMVFTNFRPRFILLKNTTRSLDWISYDSSRDLYNTETQQLYPNLSVVEAAGANIDFLSNGFKIRAGSGLGINNTSGDVYIYAAFAESPFKFALSR